jgi:hypothetical protein
LLLTLLLPSFADLLLLLMLSLLLLTLVLYPCYLLRIQGWDVSSWVV